MSSTTSGFGYAFFFLPYEGALTIIPLAIASFFDSSKAAVSYGSVLLLGFFLEAVCVGL
jgi:hypothetical protein